MVLLLAFQTPAIGCMFAILYKAFACWFLGMYLGLCVDISHNSVRLLFTFLRYIPIRAFTNGANKREIRDREKVMRGLKSTDTPIIAGFQIFHNYMRPHEALKGKTPAEACGIKVEGDNKWLTLIQNTSHQTIFDSKSNQTQTWWLPV